jgi:putative peptide zinc metalloprotease protein
MEATPYWDRLRQAASRADEGRLGLWAWLKEKLDLAQYKPERAPGAVERQLAGREGLYYILKNPDPKTYYRLSERDHFVWQLMDGTKTVKDLVVAYFMEFGSFAFARVATLVDGLRTNLLLNERPVDVYRQVRRQLLRRRPSYRWNRILSAFFERQFAVGGLDRWLTGLYRWGGRLLFSWPLQVLYVLLSAVGLYLFFQIYRSARYGFVTVAGSTGLGLVTLIPANLAVILFHEMGHALTVKHFGREVRRGGFMIYMGLPAFFVDTMDIWLEGKRARLAVTWAGPYTGLILGGLASVVMAARPEFPLNAVLYQFAVIAYLTVFFNLNPLLELDGYFLLMDGLEIPMLRHKSLEFIRTGLWRKLEGMREAGQTVKETVASFSREERIFAIFGLLSAAWTAYALFAAANLWQARLLISVRNLLTQRGSLGRMLVSLAIILFSLPFVLAILLYIFRFVRKAFHLASQRGLFDNTWHVAGMMLAVVAMLTVAPAIVQHPAARPVLNVAALAIAVYFAWRSAMDFAGSRFAAAFQLLGLCMLGFLVAEVGAQAVYRHVLSSAVASPIIIAARHLAYVLLLLAGLRLFFGTSLRQLHAVEMLLLAAGVVTGCSLLVSMVTSEPYHFSNAAALLAVTGSILPLLTLTLLVPTLFSFWRTRFGPAWLTLALALVGLVSVAMFGRYPLFSYTSLAASLFLHHLAHTQIALVRGQPEATLDLSGRHRLQRAFSWTASSIYRQLREVDGERRATELAERFNNYAIRAGWRIHIAANEVVDTLPPDLGVIERGEAYAAALTLLLQLTAQEAGQGQTVRALQTAYDALPWEDREVAAQYLFRHVAGAEALSREFQAVRQDHRGLLRRMPLFATMDEEEIGLLVSRLRSEHYAPGQVIIRQGDKGDKFYIIEQGSVEVMKRDERGVTEIVAHLGRGDYFGELALLRDAPRNATCRATVPTEVLSLSREDFGQLVKSRFALRQKVDRSLAWAELLRRMPLFAELDAQQLQLIAAQLRRETYPPGQVIMRQDEIGETFCVIESGRVQVSVTTHGEERVFAERGPGEYLGEIALLLEVPRTATVRALTETCVLALHKDDFERLVVSHLYVSRGLEREISRRMIDLQRAVEAA